MIVVCKDLIKSVTIQEMCKMSWRPNGDLALSPGKSLKVFSLSGNGRLWNSKTTSHQTIHNSGNEALNANSMSIYSPEIYNVQKRFEFEGMRRDIAVIMAQRALAGYGMDVSRFFFFTYFFLYWSWFFGWFPCHRFIHNICLINPFKIFTI